MHAGQTLQKCGLGVSHAQCCTIRIGEPVYHAKYVGGREEGNELTQHRLRTGRHHQPLVHKRNANAVFDPGIGPRR